MAYNEIVLRKSNSILYSTLDTRARFWSNARRHRDREYTSDKCDIGIFDCRADSRRQPYSPLLDDDARVRAGNYRGADILYRDAISTKKNGDGEKISGPSHSSTL